MTGFCCVMGVLLRLSQGKYCKGKGGVQCSQNETIKKHKIVKLDERRNSWKEKCLAL